MRKRNRVLGMNARSRFYLRENSKESREIADNKLRTKELLTAHGIGAAELLAVLKTPQEIESFQWNNLPSSFVIKPNRGFGGEGILVIFNRLKNGQWLTTRGRQLSAEDFSVQAHNILDGDYSLFNTPDVAIIERRLSVDPLFKRFGGEGIFDIRVIVYHNVPVMAMLRLPTKKSGGKANLAQGGLGIGIDVSTGMTTHVIVKSWLYEKEIEVHPDSGVHLRGVRVPYWAEILQTAVLSARVVGLQYCGVDISVDKKIGPVVLELNARPGLGIQVANMAPLGERLQRLQGLKVDSPERGIALSKELFAGEFDNEVASITGREVIGLIEPVVVVGKDAVVKHFKAKIDTGADRSSIDEAYARELGFSQAIDRFAELGIPQNLTEEQAHVIAQEHEQRLIKEDPDIIGLTVVSSSHGVSLRIRVPITVTLAGYKMDVEATVFDRSHLTYAMLIGKRNLSHFLIDTTKSPDVLKKPSKKK